MPQPIMLPKKIFTGNSIFPAKYCCIKITIIIKYNRWILARLWGKSGQNMEFDILKDIYSIALDVIASLISAYIIFIVGFIRWARGNPKVKISPYIAEGKTYAYEPNGNKAYKFKIANHSKFFTAGNFDIQLTAVRRIEKKNEHSFTEHVKEIDIKYGGLRILTKYVSGKKLEKIRRQNPEYTINFAYRIITLKKLKNYVDSYNYFKLSVKYKDNLNREFIIEKLFKPDAIIQGEFSNDGDIDKKPS
jgi:hypothetical protein